MTIEREIWRSVVGADKGYEISNKGRIRSWKDPTSFERNIWLDEPRILIPQNHRLGYIYVNLQVNGRSKKFYIHRMVAEAFIPNPDNLPEVNHDNGNKEDCSVENLYWATRAENMEHARRTGLWKPEETIQKALAAWETPIYCYEKDCIYACGEDAARDIGASKSLITNTCKGKIHNARGYHLCYAEEKDWLLRNIDKIKMIEGGRKQVKAINVDTGEERIYASRQEASKELNIPNSHISNIIAGRSYETRGWTFKNAPVEEIERRPCIGGH